MVAPSNPTVTLHATRLQFAQILPQVRFEAERALKDVEPCRRRRVVDRALENVFAVFVRLAERGKADIAYPKPLALSAVKQIAARRESAGRDRG
jgi:hypothetical protein